MTLAALLALCALGQDAEPPPVRMEVEAFALEKQGERLTLTFRAATDLPPGAVVELAVTPLVECFDEGAREIVRKPAGQALRRTLRVQATRTGKGGEIVFTQPFARPAEMALELSFNPQHPLLEKAAVQKALGANFRPMKWQKTALLGGSDLRLEAIAARWDAERDWVREGEKILRDLGLAVEKRTVEAKSHAAGAICADLNMLLAKVEKAAAGTPFTASAEHVRKILGQAGSFGSLLANAAGLQKQLGQSQKDAALDGGAGSAEEGAAEAKIVSADILDRLLRSLGLARDLMAREAALAGAGELARLQGEIAAAFKDGVPDVRTRKALRAAALRARGAVKKMHEQALARGGAPYRALFPADARPEGFYAAAFERLDRAAGLLDRAGLDAEEGAALARECAQGRAELEAVQATWRKLGDPKGGKR